MDREERILASWQRNAVAWSEAVRNGAIASRVAVTDEAILDAVTGASPRRVLDVGCGEGWLARRLAAQGIEVIGVDAVAELVARARAGGGATFRTLAYADLDALVADAPFDCLVCNFSLLGDRSTRAVLARMPRLLGRQGRFIVQTLYPGGESMVGEGWRDGAWGGLDGCTDPAPWYWRSVHAWRSLLREYGLEPVVERTPRWPDGRPASWIVVGAPLAAT